MTREGLSVAVERGGSGSFCSCSNSKFVLHHKLCNRNCLSSLAVLLVDVGQVALAAVDAVEVGGHEDAWAALGAHLAEALHLAGVVHLVELEDAQLHLLVLVLLLLGLGVGLLLPLLGTTQQAERHVQLGVVRHAAGGQHGGVLQLTASEHHALLLGGHALASLNGGLHLGHSGIGAELQDLSPVCREE